MYFRSTKLKSRLVSYKEAMFNCLPDDGGLYVPDRVVDFRRFFLHMNEKTTFNEMVTAVAPLFFEGCLNPVSASRVAQNAFNFQPELIKLDNNFSLLNLYDGPTGVFKDFGIAFFSAIFEEFIEKNDQTMILCAARPDTGVSMAHAFCGKKNILLVLVYPSGQIYGLDPSVFVQNGGNIIPIQIKGTFDDCQRLVIDTIIDRKFSERFKVTSANSINVGRLLPQIFYFLYAFIQIKNSISGDIFFSVPSGNFGSLIAGLYAWKFGMPVNGFIAAMNKNNSMGDYILGKPFIPSRHVTTNSPSLDVNFPRNHERLASFYEEAPAVMRNMVYPASIDDSLTLETMEKVYKNYNTFVDPHTAVAFAAAQKIIEQNKMAGHAHTIVLATGHPAKYADTVENATGKVIDIPNSIIALQKKCDPVAIIPPQLDTFQSAISSCF